jgi:hypothetical protein
MSNELVRYDAMCYAIAECHRVDEVKELRDKAYALEMYAKQVKNTDAERKACEVRLRAEIRTGELLKELARVTPPERNLAGANQFEVCPRRGEIPPSPYAQALADNGISTQAASRYQALADVPRDVIEQAFRDPEVKPSTRRLIEEARDPQPKMPSDSLWLWARCRDLERDGYFGRDCRALLAPMTETMRADMVRLVPFVIEFFTHIEGACHESA